MDDTGRLTLRYLSLDLEVGRQDGRIRAFAAVRAETEEALTFRGSALGLALARLDAFAGGADCLLGHNLIAFDLPHLAAANPDLRLLRLPAVDTLRLNPLAFPRNPYHRLVKHYQDGQLKRGRVNDPELDARLVLEVFGDQQEKLKALRDEAPDLLAAWHRLAATAPGGAGFDAFFATVRGAPQPSGAQAQAAIRGRLAGAACESHCREILADPARHGWALAYALAWLSVAGGNSVMPPWVRHQFPEAGVLVRRLRDTACNDPACGWCRERHDARKELARWFGFGDFRPEPMGGDGRRVWRSRFRHGGYLLPKGSGVHEIGSTPGAEHTPLDTNPALSTCSPRASLRASRHRRRRRQRAPADREGANDAPRSRMARSLRPTNAACSGPCSRGASLAPSVSIDLASFRPARSSHGLQDTPIDEGRCCDVPMARTTDVDGRRQRRAPGRRHAIPAPLATQSRGCMEAPSTNARLVTCRWHGRRSAGYVGCRCPRVTGSRWRAAR